MLSPGPKLKGMILPGNSEAKVTVPRPLFT